MTFICWSFATVRIQLIFGHKIAGVLPAVEGNQGLTTSPCSNLHPDCSEHISDMTKSSHMLMGKPISSAPKSLTTGERNSQDEQSPESILVCKVIFAVSGVLQKLLSGR